MLILLCNRGYWMFICIGFNKNLFEFFYKLLNLKKKVYEDVVRFGSEKLYLLYFWDMKLFLFELKEFDLFILLLVFSI